MLNSSIYRSLSSDLRGKAILPRLVEILPSSSDPETREAQKPLNGGENLEAFAHGGEEFLYVLEGVLTLMLGDSSHALYPGDSAHYKSDLPHNWANHTARNVKFIAVNVPNDLA